MELAARNIKALREQLKLSKRELAELVSDYGVKMYPTTVSRIENGEQPVKLNEAIALSKVFVVPLEQLAENEVVPNERDTVARDLHRSAERQINQLFEALGKASAEINAIGNTVLEDDTWEHDYPYKKNLHDYYLFTRPLIDRMCEVKNIYREVVPE